MIIGACGFTGSGSSAVSDYLKEYESIISIDQIEFILSHSPDGLEDLDYQLNHHCVKYTSSVVAIERFRKNAYNYLINWIEDNTIRRKLASLTEEFLDSITQVEWRGFGGAHYQLRSRDFYKYRRLNMFPYFLTMRILRGLPGNILKDWSLYPARKMQFSIQPEHFDELAKQYVSLVLETLGADFQKKIVLDQPFSGNSPQNSFKFFDNPKAIIVDRDPRDMYIFTKEFYHKRGTIYQIPTDTVSNFVKYFLHMRKGQPYLQEDDRILLLRFEDMVYRFQETERKIQSFCELSASERKYHYFFPEKSINNTQIYKRYPEYEQDIRYIEKELREYLYPFEEFGDVQITGDAFDKAKQ